MIFPSAEAELDAYEARLRGDPTRSVVDLALVGFLRLKIWLRTVIIQDAALLYPCLPSCAIFKYTPFNTPAFAHFAAHFSHDVDRLTNDYEQRVKSLPQVFAEAVRGIMHTSITQARANYVSLSDQASELSFQMREGFEALQHRGYSRKRGPRVDEDEWNEDQRRMQQRTAEVRHAMELSQVGPWSLCKNCQLTLA